MRWESTRPEALFALSPLLSLNSRIKASFYSPLWSNGIYKTPCRVSGRFYPKPHDVVCSLAAGPSVLFMTRESAQLSLRAVCRQTSSVRGMEAGSPLRAAGTRKNVALQFMSFARWSRLMRNRKTRFTTGNPSELRTCFSNSQATSVSAFDTLPSLTMTHVAIVFSALCAKLRPGTNKGGPCPQPCCPFYGCSG